MKYALVKFDPQNTESYWFEVPNDIEKCVTECSAVLCDSNAGRKRGIVYGIINVKDYKEFRSLVTNCDRDEEIIAIETYYNINDIQDDPEVTGHLTSSILLDELIYYVKNGKFRKEICIDMYNRLIDGGSAYKLHKMLGTDCVKVFQYADGVCP